jgi:hypothetical protein
MYGGRKKEVEKNSKESEIDLKSGEVFVKKRP